MNIQNVKKSLNKFVSSPAFRLILLAFAGIITTVDAEVPGAVIFALIIGGVLAVSDDVTDTTLPFLLMSATLIKCFDSFDTFIFLIPTAILPVIAFILFLKRNCRFRRPGLTFYGALAVAAAVTLGGAGIIIPKAYFSLTSLYYTLGLGIMMPLIYLIINGCLDTEKDGAEKKFALIMTEVLVFVTFMVFEYYAEHFSSVLRKEGLLAFQWRNNACTFMMITLPFPFFLAREKRHWILASLPALAALLLSGSRGGMLFGTAEFALCMLWAVVADKENRRYNLTVLSVLAAAGLIFGGRLIYFNRYTIFRMFDYNENKVRLGLFRRAVEDFKANPVFGSGLANWENRDLHPSKRFALCWYHCAPLQVVGSFGIFGVVCYALRLVTRIRVFISGKNPFTGALALSFIGLTMMSLVNPGEFCPVPYELIMTMIFIFAERQSAGKTLAKEKDVA